MGLREISDFSVENHLDLGINGYGPNPIDENSNHGSVRTEKLQESQFLDGELGLKPLQIGTGGRVKETSVRGDLGCQELTLSYMCDTVRAGSSEKEKNFWNSTEESRKYKGKEVISDSSAEKGSDDCSGRWVERDFLQLRRDWERDGTGGAVCRGVKRDTVDGDEEIEGGNGEKKAKFEPLNLSLGLPGVSLTLASSNPASADPDPPVLPKRTRSIQSLALSNNNTRASSDDFTASLSYSYSHPFSHNPSCSLNRNSTDNYEYSAGSHPASRIENDQIWYCGEGTNGSVHSRFRPVGEPLVPLHQRNLQNVGVDGEKASQIGASGTNSEHDQIGNKKVDGINLSWHSYPLMQGEPIKDQCNGLYRANSSDKNCFFPSELPARPRKGTQSADSRDRLSERRPKTSPDNGLVKSDGERIGLIYRNGNHVDVGLAPPTALMRPERILHEIVSESIPIVAQILQELPNGSLEAAKDYLKSLMGATEKREEFSALQRRLERRSDLNFDTLSKSHKAQLDILVALRTKMPNYLSGKHRLPTAELIEIVLLLKCRNMSCRSLLPVDECDCKICSTKKGFCSACMCQICLNFDGASNTCSWVGCDVCLHWCHAACGIQMNYIKPGPSVNGAPGATEMQFHCLGCEHASEMFGFVKEVFMNFAKDWGADALVKELDCVRRIFQVSEDLKGKELQNKAEELLTKLDKKLISPSDACNSILLFLREGISEFSNSSSKGFAQPSQGQRGADIPLQQLSTQEQPIYNINSSSGAKRGDPIHRIPLQNGERSLNGNAREPEQKKDEFDSLESIVRIKEAEARMFQSRADDARREAEGLHQIAHAKSQKLEEEYACKLARLCLQETEERRRKKIEELKMLENSHCDYYNMKMRMEAEIAGLLERMEATKQQWV